MFLYMTINGMTTRQITSFTDVMHS